MSAASVVSISFPGASPMEANRAAAELTDQINKGLLEEGFSSIAQQHRTDPAAQDVGQVVEMLLAAPAVVALARQVAIGIQKYMARANRSVIRITRSDGTSVEISNVESRHLAKVLAALGLNAER